ncbi:MAG: saccharopine dehydrogenase NADP-binding domain-containing protein [Pirellulales bacterium]|nr:saccharopine dehydrogenase NADP-binding domain-containing protein [Pirellulales bacterium]
MQIIVLGGAGDMGSRAVEELSTAEGVTRVTIADRNVPVAEMLAARLAGRRAKVDVRAVDARSHDDLVGAMHGYDVAASALGPFYLFEARLVAAALDAGVNYCSICDEWQAAEEIFTRYDGPARDMGRIVLTGLGTSPGMSNVAIRYLSAGMERVRRADVYCYQPLTAGGGEAVLRHMLFIMTGETRVWRESRWQTIRACSEEHLVEFPKFGRIKVWNMGHSEPATVPRYFPGIEEVNFFMGYGRAAMLFVWPARRGWFARPGVVEGTVKLATFVERLFAGKAPDPGALRIDVWGLQDNVEVHRTLCGTGTMREATGLSLAVGALMLGRGEVIAQRGVFAPEGCLDAGRFIERLRTLGIAAYHDLAMSQPI